MIVYQAVKKQFVRDCDDNQIEDLVLQQFKAKTGRGVGPAEIESWRDSLRYVASVLRDEEIDSEVGVAVELMLPQSLKRIDVTLSGYGANNTKRAVIIELKGWSRPVMASPQDGIVVLTHGGREERKQHPSYQAWAYAAFLRGFNVAVHQGGIELHSCAYLHNYAWDDAITHPHYAPYTSQAPLFLKGPGEQTKLRNFIKERVAKGDGATVLSEIDASPIKPSKALADSVEKLLRGHPEFVLLDEQKEIFEAAKAAAKAATAEHPRVVIIEGGPGTGKSVVAVNLVSALLQQGLNPRYVSRNAAPRAVYQAKIERGRRNADIRNLFIGSGAFMEVARNEFPALIVDEAHRLTEKSGLYENEGDHQVKELINAARCTIFFIDEDQRVTLKDVGTKQIIRDFAAAKGASVEEYELKSQFRCSGSDGYLAWLDDVLGIRTTANTTLAGAGYDFKVFDTPEEMHAAVAAKNTHNKARVVAGYCWPWLSKKDPTAYDIRIGDYAKRWNLTTYGSLWLMDPNSFDEVGCIHTCQGLEVEYVGVIIGPDLRHGPRGVATDPLARAKNDKTVRGYRTRMAVDPEGTREQGDRIVRNTYRALMTRGMKGCYVYATDPALRDYLRARMHGSDANG